MGVETYHLNVTREGRWWIIDAPDVEYRTQARSLTEVDEMARDLIAGALDIDPQNFNISIDIVKPGDVEARLADVAELEHHAQDAVARAARGRREAARALRNDYGLSAVDTARVLGVSRGRVYQLLDDKAD